MANQLLFAMSTLSNYLTFNDFCKNEEKINECVSQLEPISKYMVDSFDSEDVEFIILSTDKTSFKKCKKEIKRQVKDETDYKDTSLPLNYLDMVLKNNKKDETVGNIIDLSAVEFYMLRMAEYIKNEKYNIYSPECFRTNFKEIQNNNVTKYKLVGLEKNITFVLIKINENEPYDGIKEAANCIIENNRNSKGKIWIDTHGGFREVSMITNSLISLLEVYEIEIDQILGIQFSDDKKSNNYIVDQKESYDILRFVSGMNEFVNYGSVADLRKYYENREIPSVRAVLDAMEMISRGTSLCDPDTYLKGLSQLTESIKNYNNNSLEDTDQVFDIFVESIEEEYKKLLNAEDDDTQKIRVIERCINKGLYQQALTFIESTMPEVFVNKRLIYFLEKDTKYIVENQGKMNYLSPDHFIFDRFTGKNLGRIDSEIYNHLYKIIECEKRQSNVCVSCFKDNCKLCSYCTEVDKECKQKNCEYIVLLRLMNDDDEYKKQLHWPFKNNMSKYYFNKENTKYVKLFCDIEDEKMECVERLLRLHVALKNCRNMVNHTVQGQRPTYDDIKKGLEKYLELAKSVFDIEDK